MTITITRQWKPFEGRSDSAFVLAGALVLLSLVVPVGLEVFTEMAWAAGIVLIGLAVLSVSIGLAGLYPQVTNRAPRLALAGVGAAVVAGIAALGLIALVGVALVGEVASGLSLSEPMSVFTALILSMTSGFAVGFLLFGIASWKSGTPSRTVAGLLIVGGVALLAPVGVELSGLVFDTETPVWLLLSVLGLIALDILAIGHTLRPRTSRS